MIDLSTILSVSTRAPASESSIKETESRLGKSFPEAYVRLLRVTDGFDSDEVRLYPVGELEERNATYEVDTYCPDFLSIGDDGGGSAIMVKDASFQDAQVYLVGHGVMAPEHMEVVGADLDDWLSEGCPVE